MRKGFTLIELITTIAIIAIMAVVTLIYLRPFQLQSALDSTARNLMADLRHASELSSTTQIDHVLRVNITNSSYVITRLSNPESLIKQVALDPAITFSSTTLPDNTARFNTFGAVNTPGIIILSNHNNQTRTVDVRPSGYVRIQ